MTGTPRWSVKEIAEVGKRWVVARERGMTLRQFAESEGRCEATLRRLLKRVGFKTSVRASPRR